MKLKKKKKSRAAVEHGDKSDAGMLPAAYVWCCSSLPQFVHRKKFLLKKKIRVQLISMQTQECKR